MYNTVEYTYEKENHHLSDKEALNNYRNALSIHPNALIVLDDLDCGHWNMHIYQTDEEKQTFYRKRLIELRNKLFRSFKK